MSVATQSRRPAADTGARIEVRGLTKRFGDFTAVHELDFVVEPGRITGFLGPNGAGKTTTLRMLLGLIRPTSGSATIGGRSYHDITNPLREVGSALESTNFHPGRSGRDHLRVLAAASGISDARVDEMLELVGIPAAARKRAGGYSMGMRQRLGLAAALLGDPKAVILDEPSNGLDPEGIRWLRGFLRHLSSEGKTVLISSHLLQEVAQTVDDVVIIANGLSVAQGSIDDLRGEPTVLVRSPGRDELGSALLAAGLTSERDGSDGLTVRTEDMARIGDVALHSGVPIHELRSVSTDLESLYFQLTSTPENRNRNLADPQDGAAGSGSALQGEPVERSAR
ncbi:ABC transporter ATP-binding protein [Lapillicoccus sp.]|uniref:ABC transporter ATP-binding protein n=1 Tax=Lapillicoccus sp. TaxID=1909287 RepID=UPI00387E8CE4